MFKLVQAVVSSLAILACIGFSVVGVRSMAAEGGPVSIGAAMAQPNPQPAGPPVVLVAPASAPAAVDTGTIAGQALTWAVTTFGSAFAAMLTAWIYRLLQKEGVNLSDSQRARLQEITENALHLSAHELSGAIQGKGQLEVKNAVMANAVRYVQLHGADTLKALGVDPTSQAAIEAIKARALSAINDPNTPTPAMLDAAPMPAAPPAPRPPAPPAPPAPAVVKA